VYAVPNCPSEKISLDFPRPVSMCALMPRHPQPTHRALVVALCLEVGRIMEDESVAFALPLPTPHEKIAERLVIARQAGEDIAALAVAAQVLLRRG
jgi:hypothetical protein